MTTISNSTYHSPIVHVRILREQREAMLAAAETLHMSQSDLMRSGIAYMIQEAEKQEQSPE